MSDLTIFVFTLGFVVATSGLLVLCDRLMEVRR